MEQFRDTAKIKVIVKTLIATALCIEILTATALAKDLDYGGDFTRFLARQKDTGCHQFIHVDHKDLHQAQLNYQNIDVGNIDVLNGRKKHCRLNVLVEGDGQYHGDHIQIGNVNSTGYEHINVAVEGNITLRGESIMVGNVSALITEFDNLEVKQLITLKDVGGKNISIGNIAIKAKGGIISKTSLSTTINIDSINR